MITEYILFAVTFLTGYYLGGKGKLIAEEIKEKVENLIESRPTPGVVNKLNEEQYLEKHDKVKKGNLEAFNRLAEKLGWKRK